MTTIGYTFALTFARLPAGLIPSGRAYSYPESGGKPGVVQKRQVIYNFFAGNI